MMPLALLFHYLLLNMFRGVSTSIFRSLRLIVDLFHVLYCSGSMCFGVTVWFGWGGVVSLCRLKQCGRFVRLTTLPPSCAVITNSGSLNFLEPSGPFQACNETALSFYIFRFCDLKMAHCKGRNMSA